MDTRDSRLGMMLDDDYVRLRTVTETVTETVTRNDGGLVRQGGGLVREPDD